MKLSIIIPIYNAQKYLRECVDSIINQSFRDWELLLIDDGSNDESPQICDEFETKDTRIKCIHKENGGCSSARNLGIEMSQGELVAFVDADDCLDVDFYEILINAIEDTGCDIAACGYKNEYSSDISIIQSHNDLPPKVIFDTSKKSLISMTAKTNSIEGFVWNKVWKKELIKNNFFSNEVAIIDDAFFTWNVISGNDVTACYVDLPMYHYRIINSSITRNSSMDKYLKALYGYEIMIESSKEMGVDECLNGLCTDYIIWNIKTCERMLFNDTVDSGIFEQVRNNITLYKDYIKILGIRHKILANAILKSWRNYKFWGLLFWRMKKIYFLIKK